MCVWLCCSLHVIRALFLCADADVPLPPLALIVWPRLRTRASVVVCSLRCRLLVRLQPAPERSVVRSPFGPCLSVLCRRSFPCAAGVRDGIVRRRRRRSVARLFLGGANHGVAISSLENGSVSFKVTRYTRKESRSEKNSDQTLRKKGKEPEKRKKLKRRLPRERDRCRSWASHNLSHQRRQGCAHRLLAVSWNDHCRCYIYLTCDGASSASVSCLLGHQECCLVAPEVCRPERKLVTRSAHASESPSLACRRWSLWIPSASSSARPFVGIVVWIVRGLSSARLVCARVCSRRLVQWCARWL